MIPLALVSTLLAANPVLVELFTSEGCSSCPRADEALSELWEKQPVAGVRVVPLAMHVTYWNDLGWADPFADAEFDARQRRYGEAYTPQLVFGGTGASLNDVKPAAPLKLEVRVEKDGVHVAVQDPPSGDVFIALTESKLTSVVTRGENAGRTLKLAPLARKLVRGREATLTLDPSWKRENLEVVAFVQEPKQGRVLSVATQKVR